MQQTLIPQQEEQIRLERSYIQKHNIPQLFTVARLFRSSRPD
jgi:hypothetical protein